MLLSLNQFKKEFAANKAKLDYLLAEQKKAPGKFQQNTEHFANLAMATPYIYFAGLVKKHLPKNANILDWGAYLGQMTYLLQDDYKVNAYNPFENELINYWHDTLQIKTRSFDKGFAQFKLDFPANSFDAAISSGVLEHTFEFGVEDTAALRNLSKLLKPGGYLFIWNLPTKNALTEKIAMGRKRWKHTLRYDLDETLVKLNLTGFDIVAIERDELIYPKLAKLFPWVSTVALHNFDQALVRLPILRNYAHHLTIVARKIDNFPVNPASSSYTTYP